MAASGKRLAVGKVYAHRGTLVLALNVGWGVRLCRWTGKQWNIFKATVDTKSLPNSQDPRIDHLLEIWGCSFAQLDQFTESTFYCHHADVRRVRATRDPVKRELSRPLGPGEARGKFQGP